MKRKIIIDTDPGKDDVVAILMAVLSKEFDVVAITTVAGNCSGQNAANNARYVVDLLGLNIPIYTGATKPLCRDLARGKVMGTDGLEGVTVQRVEPLTGDASERIIEIVRENPGKVTIVAIGPQTNIARALQKDPSIKGDIESIVMMGGAIAVPGNQNRVAEFNIFVDPEACDIVLRSQIPTVMIPLDVCYQTPLFLEEFQKIKNKKFGKPVYQMMKSYIQAMARYEGQPGAVIFDAVAVYYLLNPNAFTLEEMDIQIETTGDLTRGMCVVERRSYVQQQKNVSVAVGIQRNTFANDFLRILANERVQ